MKLIPISASLFLRNSTEWPIYHNLRASLFNITIAYDTSDTKLVYIQFDEYSYFISSMIIYAKLPQYRLTDVCLICSTSVRRRYFIIRMNDYIGTFPIFLPLLWIFLWIKSSSPSMHSLSLSFSLSKTPSNRADRLGKEKGVKGTDRTTLNSEALVIWAHTRQYEWDNTLRKQRYVVIELSEKKWISKDVCREVLRSFSHAALRFELLPALLLWFSCRGAQLLIWTWATRLCTLDLKAVTSAIPWSFT